jgi:hypothetical protein
MVDDQPHLDDPPGKPADGPKSPPISTVFGPSAGTARLFALGLAFATRQRVRLCLLDPLGQARPQAHLAVESTR